MNEMMGGHIVNRFNDEMSQLHGLVLKLSELARSQMHDAVKTLDDEDCEAAQVVIERDKKLNDLDIEADDEIIRLIAKRQPMAKDLRDIIAVGKIVSDLERIGDQARWVARMTIHFYDGDKLPPNHHLLDDIPRMAEMVDEMIIKAMGAFENLDLEQALDVIQLNLELENEFKSALRRLSTYLMDDARHVGHVTEVVLGLRAIERAGGYAKNIAGYVVFLVKGTDVRHESLEQVAAEVRAEAW
ncbi:phosphate transport system regulatory protein PhoU [Solemya velesiana gill symbiont]|uniref:Phosphate-specific transport system accessory protein PhoU n=2 Tax=Solemya velesiana gill symbiont TaxID=1918948 RepID=A0A1T2KWW7_9GAMM|nr:phosphate transport system regulatory protein PhoU [Solemya velesiana gill symbiont]